MTEKEKAYHKEWREKNREYLREYHKKWYRENADKVREYQRQNKERLIEYDREWRKKNPEKVQAIAQRARIKRLNKRRYEYFLNGYIKAQLALNFGADFYFAPVLVHPQDYVDIELSIEYGADAEKIKEYFCYLEGFVTNGGKKDGK